MWDDIIDVRLFLIREKMVVFNKADLVRCYGCNQLKNDKKQEKVE